MFGAQKLAATPQTCQLFLMRKGAWVLWCFAIVAPASAGVLDWLLPKHDVQVITVTDTTPVGALRRRATPEAPIYYMAISAGYRDFGGLIGGEKIPKSQDVLKTFARVLAKQGYLPATKTNPPTLLLLWTWGTLNTDVMPDMSGNGFDQQINRQQMLRFLGGYKLGLVSKSPTPWAEDQPGLLFRDADADAIYDAATDDLYIAAIAAYDYAAALEKKKTLLWTTKISCPSRGLMLPETLPAMLALAGPNIGKETTHPIWIRASEKFKPEVTIGDAKVVDYIDSGTLPILEVAPPSKKGKPAAPAKK
jgi:hypothetical protein